MSEQANEKMEKKEKPNQEKKAKKVTRVELKKAPWTLERCKKYARRYSTEVLWASQAQSSYKSAVAHGWLEECLQAMTQNQGKVVHVNFGKSQDAGNLKKAA